MISTFENWIKHKSQAKIIFVLNPFPGGDHLAPEAGAVLVGSGAQGRVGAADAGRDPRGAVAECAVPAVDGGGQPPGPPHPCVHGSLPRHRVPCQLGGAVAGIEGAHAGVGAAHDVLGLASGRGAAAPVIAHSAQAGPGIRSGSEEAGRPGDLPEDVGPVTLVGGEGAVYTIRTADTTLA